MNLSNFTPKQERLDEGNREVIIYGYSDDLVEIEGLFYDEIDCWETKVSLVFGGSLRVIVSYNSSTGQWEISTQAVKGGLELPEIIIEKSEVEYSQQVRFTIPDEWPCTLIREHVSDN